MSKKVYVKPYPKEFREQVVKLVQLGDRSALEVAREFEISVDSVRLRILMNSNADSDPFRTLIPIFFERRLRSFLNNSERSNGAWNHHA